MKKISALILGAALCAGAQASTVSLTYTNSVGPVATDFGTNPINGNYSGTAPLNLSLNRFDHTLGTLQSVSLRLFGDISTNVTVTATSGSPSGKIALGTDLYFNSNIGSLNTFLVSADPTDPTVLQGDLYMETAKKNFSLTGTTPLTFNNLKAANDKTFTFTDSVLLSALTGNSSSMFSLSCSSVSETILSFSGGNATAGQSTKGTCGADITYVYAEAPPTPTPEPASLALVGLGLVGVAASRRKSRQA